MVIDCFNIILCLKTSHGPPTAPTRAPTASTGTPTGVPRPAIGIFPGKMVYSPDRWDIPRTLLNHLTLAFHFHIENLVMYLPE